MGFDWKILWALRKQIGIGILIFLTVVYGISLKHQIAARDTQISSLNKDLAAKGAEVLDLQSKLQFTESKLTDMVEAGNKAKANADYWRKNYEDQHKDVVVRLKNLNNWTPKQEEGDCDATKRFLLDYRTNANSLHP